jgi:chaperonin GroES
MKKLNPANDRVVVKPIEEDEQLYGNIIVPDMGKERPEMGKVIATGMGRMSEFGKHIPVKAKVGQIVLVPKIGSIRVELDGEEYYIVQDREILAIVEEDIEVEEI